MQINFANKKISTKTQINENQNKLTKRDFMKMILNDQIKVSHKLEDEIIKKKIIKCYLHGSDRKFQTIKENNNKMKDSNKLHMKQTGGSFLSKRMSLNLQAPSVIGTKNFLFEKKESNLMMTTYRDKSSFSRHSTRQKMRSCCNLRSSTSQNLRQGKFQKPSFKIRQIFAGYQNGRKMSSIINFGVRESPKQWEDEEFLREMGLGKTSLGFKSLSKILD